MSRTAEKAVEVPPAATAEEVSKSHSSLMKNKSRRPSILRGRKARPGRDCKETETDIPNDDWPIEPGFEYHDDITTPTKLTVVGEFPAYTKGTLYRIGPGGRKVSTNAGGTFSVDHLFDAFTQVHRFEILDSQTIFYNSRHTCDDLIASIRKHGKLGNKFSFAQRDPCKSYFKKFRMMFRPRLNYMSDPVKNAKQVNIGVTVSTDFPGLPATSKDGSGHSLYAKTDSTLLQALDPSTLEPVGIATQFTLHPDLKGPLSAAHARSCPATGDIYNFNLELGTRTVWRIFKVSTVTGKTDILASITDSPPAYIHSFFLTERHVVLCIWNSYFSFYGLPMIYHKNIVDSIRPYDKRKKNRWYVIDREGRKGIVAVYESESFYAFHSVNAWDEGGDIVCELLIYDSLDVLKKFYFNNLLGKSKEAKKWLDKGKAQFSRWRLEKVAEGQELSPQTKGKIRHRTSKGYSMGHELRPAKKEFIADRNYNFELPTINPEYVTKPTRYSYGLNTISRSSFLERIVKYDTCNPNCTDIKNHKITSWMMEGHTPGEPLFIPRPGSEVEDDGVLLSVVLDGPSGRSYLLCLDARDMKEVARAEMEIVVGLGFHGRHVPGGFPPTRGSGLKGKEGEKEKGERREKLSVVEW